MFYIFDSRSPGAGQVRRQRSEPSVSTFAAAECSFSCFVTSMVTLFLFLYNHL